LRGLTGGDGEHLEGVIAEIDGPVLLVGHSYGGSVITAADRCIDPGVHRFSDERMDAQITEVEGASHVVMISHPKQIAEVVMTAARTYAMQPA
jgi:pimeloyl-ACP methyl ester carboxylesterase